MTRTLVVDYGAGNLVSIEQALREVGSHVRLVERGTELGDADMRDADLLVVPGVGAAAPAMERLLEAGLVEGVRAWIDADRPFLGICLGLQLLFDGSDEDGATTLGVIPGRTVELVDAPTLPHIGWNEVELAVPHPAFDGIAPNAHFYFVHSYAGRPAPAVAGEVTVATTTHGVPFASAVARGRLLGVQFHPERSGDNGLRLLANVVRLAGSDRGAPRAAAGAIGAH